MTRLPLHCRPRTWILGVLTFLAPAVAPAQAEKDRPEPPIEVYDWSIWVGSPSQSTLNAAKVYRNALPDAVGTARPRAEGAELERKFAVAPVSVVQVFGTPVDDVDLDLRIKKGTILAHWPPGVERTGGIRWFKSNFLQAPPRDVPPGNIADGHWTQRLRRLDPALYLKNETRVERFLAYDAEVASPLPVKIRGGPDEYTFQNLTAQKLVDVAVIAPVEGGGYRIGWLDALPTAVPKETAAEEEAKVKAKDEERKARDKPENQARAAAAVFDDADAQAREQAAAKEKGDKAKPPEPRPIPPEADADLRARVDQALNRQITVPTSPVPRKEMLGIIGGQARLRYEVDEPTLAKEKIDLGKPVQLKAPTIAARDALAEVIGTEGLSYRITDDASLFITTAARLAEAGAKKAVIEGPPVKLALAPPVKPGDPTFAEQTRGAYARRLGAQGLRAEVVRTIMDQYGGALFEPKGLIVLAHLSRDAVDEVVPLDIFPTPKKFVRVAVVVAHGVDPRLQDQARVLVKRLGDASPEAREQAEAELYELGPVAVPVLEDALREKDVEVVYRAERTLLRLNRPVP